MRPEKPSRRPSTRAVFTITGVLVIGAAIAFAGFIAGRIAVRDTAPGGATTQPATSQPDAHAGDQFYTCGMHPWVILPEPGLCPVCHMDLTPLDPDKFADEITIDPRVIQEIGVRIEPVTSGPLVRTIRTVGTIDYDETLVRDINIKVPGWIEKLHVDFLGAKVSAGEPLLDLYSPELYAAQEEFLLAIRGQGGYLAEAARGRLEFFDISPEQIDALAETGKPSKAMTIESPYRGVVISKHANEGMRVDLGMRVYRLADLSKVWVMAAVYEHQLPYVAVGQEVVVTLPYIPGQTFTGRVIYVYPYLDSATRQINVRVELDNPDGLFKPGMFASVELRSTLSEDAILAPRSAIIDTGDRAVAFVSLGDGRFEPRDVTMGVRAENGMVQILDGLRPGEQVVTSGVFLLDSESRMREALGKMIRGEMASDQSPVAGVQGASDVTALGPEIETALGKLLDDYFVIGNQLTDDSTDGIAKAARSVADGIDGLLATPMPGDPEFWRHHDEVAAARGAALALAGNAADDIEGARGHFADLSLALDKLVRSTGVPPSYGHEVQQLLCPMYREEQGGSIWLQPAGTVRNPFMGQMMPTCHSERHALPVTGAEGVGE